MALTGEDILALIKKQPIGFACGAVAVACGVLFYFRSDKITTTQQLNVQRAGEAAKILSNVRNSASLPDQVSALQAAGKELESRVVRAGELATNLQYFYKLEAETGVKLVDARPGAVSAPAKGAPKTAFIGVPFTVTAEGGFTQVFNFIQRLENGPLFCRFNTVALSKVLGGGSDGAPATDRISVNISLEFLGQP
ncbi:MAG: hypothetical protein PHQ04_05795 [Opitutaceae bacterium]|nr:hypothetical protein [Opitutaceae bacterium]